MSCTRRAAADIVNGEEYIVLLLAAFDAVFDSNQQLQELAGHMSLREVLHTELLPTRVKVMKTNLMKELDITISNTFGPVYQQYQTQSLNPSLVGAVNTDVNDEMIGLVMTHVFDSFVLTPLELPESLIHQFQLQDEQQQQIQRQQLAEDRRVLSNVLASIGNSHHSLSETAVLLRDDHTHSADGPAQVGSTGSATSNSSLDSFEQL